MPRVHAFSFQEDMIAALAAHVRKACPDREGDFSDLAVVFPGKRPALFLRQALAAGVGRVFVPPRCFSIDEFVDYASADGDPPAVLSDLDACHLIYTIAGECAPKVLHSRERFAQFLPWAREVVSFIDHLDLEDVPSSALLNVQSKADIGYDVPESINALLSSVVAIRERFHERLARQHACTRGLRYQSAARAARIRSFDEFREIVFCGFFYLHKSERALVKALYEKDRATLFFQGSQSQWSSLDELAKEFGITIEPEASGVSPSGASLKGTLAKGTPPRVTIRAGFDMHSQVGLVRQALEEHGYSDAVVVMPNPEGVIPLVSELAASTEDFNVSLGYPLRRSSLFALVDSIGRAQSSRRESAYYAKDYLRVLFHPLVKNIDWGAGAAVTRVMVHTLEELLQGQRESSLGGSIFVGLDEVVHCRELFDETMQIAKGMGAEVTRDELVSALRQMHRAFFSEFESAGDFAGFAQGVQGLVDILAERSPLTGYALNAAMAGRLAEVARECKSARFAAEPFPSDEMFQILKDKLSHEMVNFSGSPLKGLQVLGLFETRLLSFGTVVVADLNESVLPSLKIYEPLIPREVMIGLGLDRLEKEEEIQRYLFTRLLAGCRNAVLIYEESPEKEKSRFLEALIWERQKQEGRLEVFPAPKASFRVKVNPYAPRVEKSPQVMERLAGMRYSASVINTYLSCPLRFYFQYVLALREKEEFLDEPEARDVGNFIHRLFEESFAPCAGSAPRLDARFREAFWQRFEDNFRAAFDRKMRTDAFLMRAVMRRVLEQFLEFESRRQVKEVVCLEKVLIRTMPWAGRQLSCKAVVDRIDRLPDGSLLILDYKTGGADIMPVTDVSRLAARGTDRRALADTVKSFQLPFYLMLVEQEPMLRAPGYNACLYHVRNAPVPIGISSLFEPSSSASARQECLEAYRRALDALFSQILDPGIPFDADASGRQCTLCPYGALCR